MKTLFAIAVGALALVGCGPLDESETATGQDAQALEKKVDPTAATVVQPAKVDLLRSAQQLNNAPRPPAPRPPPGPM